LFTFILLSCFKHYTWGDSDVILPKIVTVAILEVSDVVTVSLRTLSYARMLLCVVIQGVRT